MFQKKDGSLYVAFPYYKESTGLLTLATLSANKEYPTHIPLLNGGKVTGHKVKYSHHSDGSVHFSQDGKIYTQIKNNSVPLEGADGHIFTVQLQGINDFTSLKKSEQKSILTPKKIILNFVFKGTAPEAYKFVAHWYSQESLVNKITQFGDKPWFICEKPDKTRVVGMLISSPFNYSSKPYYLLLSCEGTPSLGSEFPSQLTFIGGFDHKSIALDHTKDTQFLSLAYPVSESYRDLVSRIGTVDYVKPNNI